MLCIILLVAPSCAITQEEDGDSIILRCEAEANPKEGLTFTWTRNDNETLDGEVEGEMVSVLRLPAGSGGGVLGSYQCTVDNAVGQGVPCNLDVNGKCCYYCCCYYCCC